MKNQICTSTNFSQKTQVVVDAILVAMDDLKEYLPMTVRQVYYQLVARMVIPNKHSQYRRVSRILTEMREMGLVPWTDIEDRSRRTTEKRGAENVNSWLADQLEWFANPRYYGRCLVQQQATYCEVLTEKDALSSILEEITWEYCTRLNVIRGHSSSTHKELLAGRFAEAQARGQELVMLHLGDLDPSGAAIPKIIQRDLKEIHGVDVQLIRVGLNPEQVDHYHLPTDPEALKQGDPNLRAWLAEYGPEQAPVELDALHPADLQNIVREALSSVYDMHGLDAEKIQEVEDRKRLKVIRAETINFLYQTFPELELQQTTR